MTHKSTVIGLISKVLLRHALHVCPPARANWIAAAANEVDSMTDWRESLSWSIGTVRASYTERLRAMSLNAPQLPGFVLILEVLLCFLPSSLLWACAVGAIARGTLPWRDSLCLFSAALIGPVGLVILGQLAIGIPSSGSRWRSLTLTCLAGWAAALLVLPPLTPPPLKDMSWRDCVLLILLPVIGAAHYAALEYKSRPPQSQCPG